MVKFDESTARKGARFVRDRRDGRRPRKTRSLAKLGKRDVKVAAEIARKRRRKSSPSRKAKPTSSVGRLQANSIRNVGSLGGRQRRRAKERMRNIR